ncbi:MAG TPA: hypothetical protein PK961_09510 [bacterium]|nr:hypothetical protein [bacterium]
MRCRECGREFPEWSWENPICPPCLNKEKADAPARRRNVESERENIDADDFYQRHPDLKINLDRADSELSKPIAAQRESAHIKQTLPPPVEIPRRHESAEPVFAPPPTLAEIKAAEEIARRNKPKAATIIPTLERMEFKPIWESETKIEAEPVFAPPPTLAEIKAAEEIARRNKPKAATIIPTLERMEFKPIWESETKIESEVYRPEPLNLNDIIEREAAAPTPEPFDEKYETTLKLDEPEPPSLSSSLGPPVHTPTVDLHVQPPAYPTKKPEAPPEPALPTRKISDYSPSGRVKIVIEAGSYLSVKVTEGGPKEDSAAMLRLIVAIVGGIVAAGMISLFATPFVTVLLTIGLLVYVLKSLPKKQNLLLTPKGMDVEMLVGNMIIKTRHFTGRPDNVALKPNQAKSRISFSPARLLQGNSVLEIQSQTWNCDILPAVTDADRQWLLPHVKKFIKSIDEHRHEVRKANR